MNAHIDDLLPFYTNHSLSTSLTAHVETHLAACALCRARLAEWEKLAALVNQEAGDRLQRRARHGAPTYPALSPLVVASLKRRPAFKHAVLSAANLIWAQRIFLPQGWPVSALVIILLSYLAGWFVRQALGSCWTVFPLFAVIPISAALSAAFLFSFDQDPSFEIVSSAPTSAGTLFFARLTLALGVISMLAFLSSLLLVVMGLAQQPFFELVAVWLGPTMLITALATVLSLCLRPLVAAGTALLAWGMLVILLIREQAGFPVIKISLLPLLHPGWALLAGQVLLAGLLWLAGWAWLAGRAPFTLRTEGGH